METQTNRLKSYLEKQQRNLPAQPENSAARACIDDKSVVSKSSRLTRPKSFSEGPNFRLTWDALFAEEGKAGRLTYYRFVIDAG